VNGHVAERPSHSTNKPAKMSQQPPKNLYANQFSFDKLQRIMRAAGLPKPARLITFTLRLPDQT
jgi:hypothetical protein